MTSVSEKMIDVDRSLGDGWRSECAVADRGMNRFVAYLCDFFFRLLARYLFISSRFLHLILQYV